MLTVRSSYLFVKISGIPFWLCAHKIFQVEWFEVGYVFKMTRFKCMPCKCSHMYCRWKKCLINGYVSEKAGKLLHFKGFAANSKAIRFVFFTKTNNNKQNKHSKQYAVTYHKHRLF